MAHVTTGAIYVTEHTAESMANICAALDRNKRLVGELQIALNNQQDEMRRLRQENDQLRDALKMIEAGEGPSAEVARFALAKKGV